MILQLIVSLFFFETAVVEMMPANVISTDYSVTGSAEQSQGRIGNVLFLSRTVSNVADKLTRRGGMVRRSFIISFFMPVYPPKNRQEYPCVSLPQNRVMDGLTAPMHIEATQTFQYILDF